MRLDITPFGIRFGQSFATHVRGGKGRNAKRATHRVVLNPLLVFSSLGACQAVDAPEPVSPAVGHAHVDTSCSPATSLGFGVRRQTQPRIGRALRFPFAQLSPVRVLSTGSLPRRATSNRHIRGSVPRPARPHHRPRFSDSRSRSCPRTDDLCDSGSGTAGLGGSRGWAHPELSLAFGYTPILCRLDHLDRHEAALSHAAVSCAQRLAELALPCRSV
jgi:hypothetical protein